MKHGVERLQQVINELLKPSPAVDHFLSPLLVSKPDSFEKFGYGDVLDLSEVPDDVLAFIQKLPVEDAANVLKSALSTPLDYMKKEMPVWFILRRAGRHYLVDTEGYPYMRYVLRLVGMEKL